MMSFPILQGPQISALFQLFANSGIEARLVGGCVRDSLLGLPIHDIDIAVAAPPQMVVNALRRHNVKTIPTGIQFGTITAVVGDMAFEVTSLRRDCKTDGRHPVVEFGTDWLEDASRRDFTINALYLDADGRMFDFFGGKDDLANGVIRFIGDPAMRIKEDYLRILRYYRFLATHGRGMPAAIPALRQMRKGLGNLSTERIQREIIKLLKARNPLQAIDRMIADAIFSVLYDADPDVTLLQNLIQLEAHFSIPDSSANEFPLRRFFTLFRSYSQRDGNFYQKNFRLSCKQTRALETIESIIHVDDLRWVYHKYGKEHATDWIFLRTSMHDEGRISFCETALAKLSDQGDNHFPLNGADLLKINIKPGRALGEMLDQTERWWVVNNCLPTKDDCLSFCASLVGAEKENPLINL
ncbi:MAG: CCA tRNA nucleotidyltransferase [Alphaproteobacteria bacterium]|nr:CCA tRNA nucleotidyltransferase [Alphaproteobacteria bacterium]